MCPPPRQPAVESKRAYQRNPDGSGKVVFEALLEAPTENRTGADPEDINTQVRKAIAAKAAEDIVLQSVGTVAWKDVTFGLADGWWTSFRGTAYFDSASQLRIGSMRHYEGWPPGTSPPAVNPPGRAVVTGDLTPLFDYQAEVAEAKKGYQALLSDLAQAASLSAARGGEDVAIWQEAGGGFTSGPYPWRSIGPEDCLKVIPGKLLLPILGPLAYAWISERRGPTYLDHVYASESVGSAYLVPVLENLAGRRTKPQASPYIAMVDDINAVEGGDHAGRFSLSSLSGPVEDAWRAEARIDFPGYFGFFGGVLDLGGSNRSYFRFTNAFVMNTRAVASLDLGSVHTRGQDRFEWGVNADVFPRKPLLLHFAYHEFGGPDESELGLSLGVALKALEITAGWTRVRDAGDDHDMLEAAARLWWAF